MNPFDRPDSYTPQELMAATGIGTAIYNQWLYRNLISAEYEAHGPGTVSSFTFNDILIATLVVLLKRANIRLKKASELAHEIVAEVDIWMNNNKDKDTPMVYLSYSDDGEKVQVGKEKKGEMVLHLDIFTIVQNIQGRIEEMPPDKRKNKKVNKDNNKKEES